MRTPVVDYRKLRLHNLHTPEYSHLLLLLGWVGYFLMYTITETFIPAENCHVIHCWLDDVIPFLEIFVIPYVLWYLLIVVSLGYFALYNIESFKKLQTYIIITQIIAMICYIAYPTRQDLRPESFERDNIFTRVVGFMYVFDTNTGVCPSLHCIGGFAIFFAAVDMPRFRTKGWIAFFLVFALMICASTVFMKQHSIVDFCAALPVVAIGWLAVYLPAMLKARK